MIQSAIALSAEIDDVFSAATDLAASIRRDLAFQKNSIGILYYDYEVESDLLARYLEDMLAIPIIGCSSIALLEGKTGYHEMSVMLSVLTSSDCFFSASVTNPLTQENACQELIAGCDAVRRSLVGEPKMLFFLPPLKPEIVMDRCLESLTEAAGGVPVLGGVPSGKGELLNSILFSGNVQSESAVLLMVSGPIHPVYAFANVLSPISDRRGIVTRAVDTTIYEVDGMPLVDFFESYGLRVRDLPSSAVESFFNKYPLIIQGTESTDQSDLLYVRFVNRLNQEDGSGLLYTGVPNCEGVAVSLAILQREDIAQSLHRAMESVLTQVANGRAHGETYTTIICISCGSRHEILNPIFDMEGAAIRAMLPPDLSLFGFYAFGELCPVKAGEARMRNQMHNASIVFCAI